MDRREALKKLGMGGATLLGASAVMSSPAFADSGTVNCRYTYGTAATTTITLTRPANNTASVAVTTTAPAGSCPCGAGPTVTYAYYAALTGNATVPATSGGWVANTTFNATNLAIGGGNSAFGYNVQVGVRVQCSDKNGNPTFICRFYSASGTNGPTTIGPNALTATSAANLPGC